MTCKNKVLLHLSAVVTCLLFFASPSWAAPSTSGLIHGKTRPEYEPFPYCNELIKTDCLEEFLFAPASDPTNFGPPPAELRPNVIYSMTTLSFFVFGPEYQELFPIVEPGSIARIKINVGDFKLGAVAHSSSNIKNVSYGLDPEGRRTFSIDIEAAGFTFAMCNFSNDRSCPEENWYQKKDMTSRIEASLPGLWGSSEDRAWEEKLAGLTISSNASSARVTYPTPYMPTIFITLQAPHTKADNQTLNIGRLEIFIPNTLLFDTYGLDPDSLVRSNQLTKLSLTSSTDRPVPNYIAVKETNGIRLKFSDFTYSTHSLRIKPKKLLTKPSRVSTSLVKRKVKMNIAKVNGAKKYQAACSSKGVLKKATGKRGQTSITVKNLSKGNWLCRGRGLGKYGGAWSDPVRVKIAK